ncbi:alpha/beta hydrolase [Xanthomonas sp. PPL139]|uniref:alpha/beta hydrolase n=1 Tax=unclassified Xanthomonas TaxID=2643310 RepID=UPI0033A76B2F
MSTRHSPASAAAFSDFTRLQVDAGGVAFAGAIGGSGPPVLLLHGFPQTHLAWRRVAPRLAQAFTVIVPDLPGYGASRPHSDQPRWSKRRVGEALVALMAHLGHTRFAVVGHDRGARAGYRLALDHPARVTHYASLTVVPTQDAWDAMDMRQGLANFHWFLLAQPFDLPERLLAADPDAFIETVLARMAGGLDRLDPAARAAYTAAFRDPAVRHAICEDYRAAAHEDLEHDAADRTAGNTLRCPVLVLWPQAQAAAPSPLALWRRWASDVSGKAISGGHLQPEHASQDVLAALLPFLSRP